VTSRGGHHALALLLSASLWLWAVVSHAHTPLMSVLLLEEGAPGEFNVRVERTQGIANTSAAYDLLKPVFPEHCRFEPPRLQCGDRGLAGRIGFDGLADLSTSGTIKIQRADGSLQTVTLTSAQPHLRLATSGSAPKTFAWFANFVWIGVTHILLGVDHLSFVLGLLWLLDSWRALLKTVTAFTVGHSVTLTAATLGWTDVPSAPVEAIIALSIAFVAVEVARERHQGVKGLTRRSPWIVALAFGLLHGFGFANALAELQVAPAELPLALLSFNAGVELGQLSFIAVMLALRKVFQTLHRRPLGWVVNFSGPLRLKPEKFTDLCPDLSAGSFPIPSTQASLGVDGVFQRRLSIAGYYAMGGIAMYWFFERVSAFGAGG
jgi:hydrogenase/urease accessory protein HupE